MRFPCVIYALLMILVQGGVIDVVAELFVDRKVDTVSFLAEALAQVNSMDALLESRTSVCGITPVQVVGSDRFDLGPVVSSSAGTTTVVGHLETPDKVRLSVLFKYMNDCSVRVASESVTTSHPLVSEYMLLYALNALDQGMVSPKVYFISRPCTDNGDLLQSYEYNGYGKFINRFVKFEGLPVSDTCSQVASVTRYLVMQTTGISVSSYIEHKLRDKSMSEISRLTTGINFGIAALSMVLRMHSLGIVHGSLKSSIIRFRDEKLAINEYELNAVENPLVISDFSGALFVGDFDPRTSSVDALFDASPWAVQASIEHQQRMLPTFRDDVYRIIEIMANILWKGMLAKNMKSAPDATKLLQIKNAYTLFPNTKVPHSASEIGSEIMHLVRGLTQDDIPSYGTLIGKLELIKQYLKEDSKAMSNMEVLSY